MEPCHHDTARFKLLDGGDGLWILRIMADIWNKQSRTADGSVLQIGEFGEKLTKLFAIKTYLVTNRIRESGTWTNPWSRLLPRGDNTHSITCFCATLDTSSVVQFSKLFHLRCKSLSSSTLA